MTRIMHECVVLKRVTASFLSTIMALTIFFVNSSALAATSDRFPSTPSAAFNLNTTGGLGADQEPAYSRVFEVASLTSVPGHVKYTAPIDMQVSISTEGTVRTRIEVFNNVNCYLTQRVANTTDGRNGLVVDFSANQTYWIKIAIYANGTSAMSTFNFSAIVERDPPVFGTIDINAEINDTDGLHGTENAPDFNWDRDDYCDIYQCEYSEYTFSYMVPESMLISVEVESVDLMVFINSDLLIATSTPYLTFSAYLGDTGCVRVIPDPDQNTNLHFHRGFPTSGSEQPFYPADFFTTAYYPCGTTNCYMYALCHSPVITENVVDSMIPPYCPGSLSDGFYIPKSNIRNPFDTFILAHRDDDDFLDELEGWIIANVDNDLAFLGRGGGISVIGKYDKADVGFYKVALKVDVYEDNSEFHWYRQLPDGTWGNKMNVDSPIVNTVSLGSPIMIWDPEVDTSEEGNYWDGYPIFLGFFQIPAP